MAANQERGLLHTFPAFGGGKLINMNEAVAVLGISAQAIRAQIDESGPEEEDKLYVRTKGKEIMIDAGRFVMLRVRKLVAKIEENHEKQIGYMKDNGEIQLDAKERKLEAEAELAEIKVAELRGQLVPLEIVQETVTNEYANVRAKLRGLPAKMAGLLMSATGENQIRQMLETEIDNALAELANGGIPGAGKSRDTEMPKKRGRPRAGAAAET